MLEPLQTLLLLAGALFCLIGSYALLRFPDVYTRIHALTKVDNLGLGLAVLGLLLTAESLLVAVKLVVIWLLVLFASGTTGHLIARNAELRGQAPWRRKDRRKRSKPPAGQAGQRARAPSPSTGLRPAALRPGTGEQE